MIEGQYLRRDGTLIDVERVVRRISWQGKPSILVLVRDISERKRVEVALRKQRELLETVMNCMDPTLAAWDKDLKLIAWNRRWEEEHQFPEGFLRTGIDYEDVLRRGYAKGRFKYDDMEKSIAEHLAQVTHGIEADPVVERPDGTIVLRKRHPLPGGGFVATHIDITELKKAQQLIEEQARELRVMAQKSDQAMRDAQAANQAKSEFLALMSHELRTPLNAVLGFSEIISSQAFGPLGTNKYSEYAKDIYSSGQHLLELINDILDLSKVESGKDEIHEEEIRVEDLVAQLIPLVSGRAQRGGITLRSECAGDQCLLRGDKRKLKQILVNVLSNAIKFTLDGGLVILRACFRPDIGYVFQVIDSGIGIAPEDISRALSPFQQVESELNRKVEGTGLGLPLSKALVELHGGTLDLQSEVGVGTTVTVCFPLERVIMPKAARRSGLRRTA
jgi:two-component system cell cycle sensor histidine kinase PleC